MAVGANETVVLASDPQEAMRGELNNLKGRLAAGHGSTDQKLCKAPGVEARNRTGDKPTEQRYGRKLR